MAKVLSWNNDSDLEVVKSELKNDNIVISSTDTIYGFLGNITKKGFEGICKLKGVKEERPFLILVSKYKYLEKIAKFVDKVDLESNPIICKFIESCWPGPVTFVFKGKKLDFLSAGRGTIAIRCPEHDGLQKILSSFDGLFSTSANRSGMPAPVRAREIDPELLCLVGYLVTDFEKINLDELGKKLKKLCDAGEDTAKENIIKKVEFVEKCDFSNSAGKASTIVDLSNPDFSKEFPFTVIREGDFTQEMLLRKYNSLIY